MNELAELVDYKYYEPNDVILNIGEECESMFLILDGDVKFDINVMADTSEKFLKKLCEDINYPFQQLAREVEQYRKHNHLTEGDLKIAKVKSQISAKL